MQVELLETMISMFRSQGIQVLLAESLPGISSEIDYGFRKNMFPHYDYIPIAERLEHLVASGILYQFEDDLKLCYTLYSFPDSLRQEYESRHLCIGPVLFHPINSGAFHSLMEEKHVPTELYQDVQEFYNRVPQVSSFDSWINTLIFFLSRLSGHPVEFRLIQDGALELFQSSYSDYSVAAVQTVASRSIEERYALETDIINAVAAGNAEQALQAHYKFRQYRLLPRTPDPVRDQKNLMITLNTLLRKAAQSGHVHPLHIDNLSRQLAIQIESTSSTAQLNSLANHMVRKYCMLVKNYSRNAYSSLVQTCMDYVDFHYMEELALDTLAKLCNVTNSYLSSLFKKEVGMTVTDYINSTRIRQALILLNGSSLSIQEIASQCGFSDSNYFTRTFKKFQGKSPKSYRESIKKY